MRSVYGKGRGVGGWIHIQNEVQGREAEISKKKNAHSLVTGRKLAVVQQKYVQILPASTHTNQDLPSLLLAA